MPEIMIDPELYERVEKAALEQETSTNDIFSEAVQHYLWELNRRKISEETRIYRQQHEQFKENYLGHYIAMFQGQVVDHDEDFQALHQRVRQQYKRQPVMITLVEETADPVLTRHGFRWGTNKT
jgi:glutamyl-tRNA reductase